MKSVKSTDESLKIEIPDDNLKPKDSMIAPKAVEEVPEITRNPSEPEKKLKDKPVPDPTESEVQKYEIKLVSKHRFPSTINIKTIDNLPILKNWEISDMKNVFVIKNNFKTYIFTLTDNTSDKRRALETAKSTLFSAESERVASTSVVYLKVYGTSEPDETFSVGIIRTIQDQVDQIALFERAESIYTSRPKIEDYRFVNDNGNKVVLLIKIPAFARAVLFLKYLKLNLNNYLIAYRARASRPTDSFVGDLGFKP
mmetsp:Transcript_2184/g.2812  ORF Transcript_2184/g.2812 Transcript_2184/m.2812 type:complete len:255 (+) Transcript_2184:1948-2712(+)